ncbi:HNH endonuclease [Cohnella sp. 56]|uniref:HNH endonuclease n=1 Tax=Cohnella sp. 56 TaxID=3113722 RepID=UPI0030E77D6D
MPIGDFNPAPKPSAKKQKTVQSRRGDIGAKADKQLKERSKGICERCGKAEATERAHITGRPHIGHNTTVLDLVHLCAACHDWLDESPDGIQTKRMVANMLNSATIAQE